MRAFAFCLLGLILGYVAGAVLGYAGVELFSPNVHDKDLEAGMTAAFAAGPLGAVIGLVIGALLARK